MTRADPELENIEWSTIWNENEGFFIEADIEIPDDVKSDLANFPPAPHRVTVTHAALSEFAQNLIQVCMYIYFISSIAIYIMFIYRIPVQTMLRARNSVSHYVTRLDT